MYTLIRHIGTREGLLIEAPSLIVAMVVAELFYKFHSFTFECAAFLATWLAASYLTRLVSSTALRFFRPRPRSTP